MSILLTILIVFTALFMFSFPLIIILFFGIKYKNKNKKIRESAINKILSNDPKFDENSFLDKTKEIILMISKCKLTCDYVKLMDLESKLMYENDYLMINNFLNNDCIKDSTIEDILNIMIVDYKKDDDCEHIFCKLTVNIRKITVIPSKNEITEFEDMPTTTFKYVDVVRKNTTSNNIDNINCICQACGAELEINNLGRCIYCNSLVSNDNPSWVINRIDDYYFISGNEK